MISKHTLLSILAFLGSATASPQIRAPRCNNDNLLRCFNDARYTAQASNYCGGLTVTTTVATVTATSTASVTDTVADQTVTNTITATETIYTATVPSSTITVTRAQPQKRQASPAPPRCMTNGVTYPEARITSACSCIEVAAKTVSVTYTAATQTVTAHETEHATATASTTVFNTVYTDTTSGVATVTVDPPAPSNVIVNPGFEDGLSSWNIYSGGINVVAAVNPGYNSEHAFRAYADGHGIFFSQDVNLVQGKTYDVGFVGKYLNGGNRFYLNGDRLDFVSRELEDGWVEYKTTFTAGWTGSYFFEGQCNWVGDFRFDNFFIIA